MFNRTYQLRAVRQAGPSASLRASSGHEVAAALASHLPWGGIFEPWRPLVLMAEVAKVAKIEDLYKKGKNAAVGCRIARESCADRPRIMRRKSSRQMPLFDGKLRGIQLSLPFAAAAAEKSTPVEVPITSDEDLEAYFNRLFPL